MLFASFPPCDNLGTGLSEIIQPLTRFSQSKNEPIVGGDAADAPRIVDERFLSTSDLARVTGARRRGIWEVDEWEPKKKEIEP